MSVIISNLPSYTGSATDLRWFVMNNSGETTTYKYSGYSSQLIPGTGADSYSTPNATASGTNAVAIGNGAIADGNNSVNIGNSTIPIGASSVCIGKHYNSGSNSINIGGGAYNYGSYGIAIGYETSSQNGGIAIGSNTTRANGSNSVSLGHAIERNNGINSVVIGYDNSAGLPGIFNGNPYGVIIGSGHRAETTGFYNTILGGYGNYITGTTSGTTLLGISNSTGPLLNDTVYLNNLLGLGKSSQFNTRGGTGNTETANSYSNFIVGTGNTVGNVSTQHVVFGEGNTSTGGADSVGAFVFGKNNSTTNASQRWGAVFGAYNNLGASTGYIFGVNNLNLGLGSICIGENHILAGDNSSAIGEGNRVITSYNHSIGRDNDIEAGNYNGMMGGNNGRNNSGSYNGFLGGLSNTNNTSSYGGFIGGESNTITGSGDRNVMVGGSGNTISGKTDVVMLGTTGRTASASTTTYTENLHVYRTPSTQVQPISSGTTFTCDLENGGKAQYYITGTSTVNITNVRDGASFMIKTQTDGNYVMTWTATGGYTFVFEGGIKDPGNTTTDIFVFEVFGSVIYGSRRHNFS